MFGLFASPASHFVPTRIYTYLCKKVHKTNPNGCCPGRFLTLLFLQDTRDKAGRDSAASLTDVESLAGLSSHGAVCLEDHLDVVTRHNEFAFICSTREAEMGGFVYNQTG